MKFDCPRCHKATQAKLYGPCSNCRNELKRIYSDRFTVIAALDDVLDRNQHIPWLVSPNPLLDGESPWDRIVDGHTDDVLGLVLAIAEGVVI